MGERMIIVIGFKNNQEIEVECTSFEIKRNALEQITCLSWEGLKGKKPLWMDVSQILYIYKKIEEENKNGKIHDVN